MLRWAVLGTGFISSTVVEAIDASDGSAVHVAAGRNSERLEAFQAKHGIVNGATDYDEAISDPEVDAVYIGLPNHQHHPWALAASKAGKAVLSEKSLTTTLDTAETLLDGVRSNGTLFVEGLMYLAHPVHQRLTEVLLDGRLGSVRSISGRYAADIAGVVNPEGKGTIYNLGCYPASLLHLVIQTVFGPDAFGARSLAGTGNLNADWNVSDAALAVRFDNGVLATLQSSDSFGNASEFSIIGDNGVLRFETNPWLPVAGDNVIVWQPFAAGESERRIVVSDDHDAFYHQIKLVEQCVAAGRTEAGRPSPRLQDSHEIMVMLTEWETACLAE